MSGKTIPADQEYLYKPYRWLILILICLIQIAIMFSSTQVSALGSVLIKTMHLSSAEFGALTVASFLTGAIFGLPCGLLADRYGVKKVIGVGVVLATIGGILKIFAYTFPTLFIAMFLIGFSAAVLNSNSAKIISLWFSKLQMSIAMSIYIAASTIGSILALLTTTRIIAGGGSRTTVFIYGAIAVSVPAVLWLIFAKSKPVGAPIQNPQQILKYIGEILNNRHLWISSAIAFLLFGAIFAGNSFTVVGFTTMKHVSIITAGTISTMAALLFLAGVLIIPSIISKMGSYKVGYIVIALFAALGITLGWLLPFGTVSMIFYMIGYLFIGAGIPINKQYPALLPGIRREAIGSAGGIQTIFLCLGQFLMPSYILGTIAGSNISIVFYGIGVVMVLSAILTIFLPEVGWRAKTLIELESSQASI